MAAALGFGLIMHAVFAVAVLAMIIAMFFGMSRSFGSVPQPYAWIVNIALLLQFPIAHSLLLNGRGRTLIARLVPGPHGPTLATTTFALIASLQLAALFLFWTPSGTIWWQATGPIFALLCCAYAAAWGLLIKASYDAGAEVQSGALGWMSMFQGRKPRYPGMPQTGLFRYIRQPIYVSFALTTWTVPVWTPDQLLVAIALTAYCLVAPILKERRFARQFGREFTAYQERTPYALPRLTWHRAAAHPSESEAK